MNLQSAVNTRIKVRPVAHRFDDYSPATCSTASSQMTTITAISDMFCVVDDTMENDYGWFWSESWQRGEVRADDLYGQGKITRCETIDEVIKLLRAKAE